MVVVGSALMVALNGLSAGAADFISKQLSFLAPNVDSVKDIFIVIMLSTKFILSNSLFHQENP
jgi:hypothetical protein